MCRKLCPSNNSKYVWKCAETSYSNKYTCSCNIIYNVTSPQKNWLLNTVIVCAQLLYICTCMQYIAPFNRSSKVMGHIINICFVTKIQYFNLMRSHDHDSASHIYYCKIKSQYYVCGLEKYISCIWFPDNIYNDKMHIL